MQRSRSSQELKALLLLSVVATMSGALPGSAQTPDELPGAGHLLESGSDGAAPQADSSIYGAAADETDMQLDVSVNGYKLDLVAGFAKEPDGTFSSRRSELADLGLKVPGKGADDQKIRLGEIPGLSYVYNEANQAIDLRIANSGRMPKVLAVRASKDLPAAESDIGVALNYSAYGAANYDLSNAIKKFEGANVSLDARAYSNLGVIEQTGIVGTTTFSDFTALRLDTTWSYANQSRMETYRLGDVISGGLRWTRPVRMGGGQVQRSFDLRPDLITAPIPVLAGSAAVPSTLDVYINEAKTYTQDIPPGPFEVTRLPTITGNGKARVVLTDTAGRQTQTETDFYSSPDQLASGLYDYSLEIGLPRKDFGQKSFSYDGDPIGSGSFRYGINDMLTLETHAELSPHLLEGGAGLVYNAGPFGTFSAAAAASHSGGDDGLYFFGSWDARYGNFNIHASTARTAGSFRDLAAVTAVGKKGQSVAEATDQIVLSYGLPELQVGAGVSLAHVKTASNETALLGADVMKSFDSGLSIYGNAFVDLEDTSDFGAFVGFSMPLGETMTSSAGASYANGNLSAAAEVSRPMDSSYGSYGWRVTHQEQQNRVTSAGASYRGSKATVSGQVALNDSKLGGNVTVEGSVVATRGGLMLGNKIQDSFAVVDAGYEGVDVSYENRFVGKTDSNGQLLITQLRAYQANKVSIAPDNLPVTANVPETDKIVVPKAMSGVRVDFGVNKSDNMAIVVIKDARGKDIQPGTEIRLQGHDEPFVMGYDGEVYMTGLQTSNQLTAVINGTECTAQFDFEPQKETMEAVGPLQCL